MTASVTPTKASSLWADVPRRLTTIAIGFPLVWTMLSHPTLATLFFLGAQSLSLWEFTLLEPSSSLPKNETTPLPSSYERFLYCFVSVALAGGTTHDDTLFHLLLSLFVGGLVWRERRHMILGTLLVSLPFRAWLQLASTDFASTISILLVVWNCDTGALLAGRLYHKTGFPRMPVPLWIRKISPAKSMEGFVGGILGGVWTAVSWVPALTYWADLQSSSSPVFEALWSDRLRRLGLGIVLSLLAIVGDLVESSIKRQSRSKDSGKLLPGHGGVLDRFDSSLLAVLLYQFLSQKVVNG